MRLTGILWCLVFVALDAVQAVYFGSAFQQLNSLLIGVVVFGLTAAGSIGWLAVRKPEQLRLALRYPGAMLALNVTNAGAWLCYFLALQRIEPAVAFAFFCGLIPLTTIVAAWCGIAVGQAARNRLEATGNAVLLIGLVFLAWLTLTGRTGFVRGGIEVALAGLVLVSVAGVMIASMLMVNQHLHRRGLGALAQYALRFPLYIVLALAGLGMGIDSKASPPVTHYFPAILAGLVLLAFPVYAVQRAVAAASSLTIGSIAATAPLVVFALQRLEGRVDYSTATLAALSLFFLGSLLAAAGTTIGLGRESNSAKT